MMKIVLIILATLIVFYLQVKVTKTWITPDSIYAIWMCIIIIFTLALHGEYFYDLSCFVWSFASIFCLTACCLLGKTVGGKLREIPRLYIHHIYNKKYIILSLLIVFWLLGILCTYFKLEDNGFSILAIKNLDDIRIINDYLSKQRYAPNGAINYSIFGQICLCFTYGVASCCGYMFEATNSRARYFCLLGLLPNILLTLFESTKTGTFFAVILFASGYLISYIERNGLSFRINIRQWAALSVAFVLFILFMYMSLQLRYTFSTYHSPARLISEIFFDYVGSSIVNFSQNFQYYLGKKDECYLLSVSTLPTANAFWIKDFKWYGVLLMYCIRGITCGIAINRLVNGRCSVIGKTALMYLYVNAFYFFVSPPFNQTTVLIGSCVIFPFFLVIYNNVNNKE